MKNTTEIMAEIESQGVIFSLDEFGRIRLDGLDDMPEDEAVKIVNLVANRRLSIQRQIRQDDPGRYKDIKRKPYYDQQIAAIKRATCPHCGAEAEEFSIFLTPIWIGKNKIMRWDGTSRASERKAFREQEQIYNQ
jgi:hypothetical protein